MARKYGDGKRLKRTPPRLFVHGITTAEWTRRYGVEPFSHPCSECGRVLTTTLPFAQGTLRGLEAPTCECGNERTPYAMLLEGPHGLAGLPS